MAEKSASFGALPNVPLNLVSVATLTRFKGTFGRAPKLADFSAIELQASTSARLVDGIEAIIPQKDWSPRLRG